MNLSQIFYAWQQGPRYNKHTVMQRLHLDGPLLSGICLLAIFGLFILYSASNQSIHMVEKQVVRMGIAVVIMLVFAQIPPEKYRLWAPWIYGVGVFLLILVLIVGQVDLGARRWLNLGFIRFQPSEIMNLAIPMMLAWFFHDKRLPPSISALLIASIIILIPAALTAKQPDLGTAILIMGAGMCVLVLSGMSWRLIGALALLGIAATPLLWHFMQPYQQQRVLTFLNPERAPLGSGYHIIQSKIAIGSGGIFGKGWLHGTQSHLQFLPEHSTDFIFAVCGEELGLIGCFILISIYLFIIARSLYIASQAQDTFTRLLAGSLTLTFFLSMFINIGMVTGILPVVGLPLPLVSYGGSSIVTFFACFGIIMSIHNHRKLVSG